MNKFQQSVVKRNNFRTVKSSPARNRGPVKKTLNPELFIRKAQPLEETRFIAERQIKDLPVQESIISNLLRKGYISPTEIQDKTIEPILEGHDLLGLAQTGTGKTGAFLIPLAHHLIGKLPGYQVLVITPTRELAVQIEQEFRSITAGLKLFSECLIGGTDVRRDLRKLKNSYHLIIGTPGRITDMVRQGALDLRHFKTLVLDEFDRLLDMGFSKDIMQIVRGMQGRKQTILFSATEDKGQQALMQQLLKSPVEVRLKGGNERGDNIDQEIIKVPQGGSRMDLLIDLIDNPTFEKVLVFADTKRWVSRICKNLRKAGVKADEIHGNKSQHYRISALEAFRNKKIKVLVATDVAARGLDIVNVSHVINFHAPQNIDSYIHRIGRTGRAGKSGKAFTFVD